MVLQTAEEDGESQSRLGVRSRGCGALDPYVTSCDDSFTAFRGAAATPLWLFSYCSQENDWGVRSWFGSRGLCVPACNSVCFQTKEVPAPRPSPSLGFSVTITLRRACVLSDVSAS